jgi:23S rRNA-/tRNA-specific pseudouridylate synthase
MKVVGAPIVGDATYEGKDAPQNLVERMCLHAFQLQIEGVVDTTAPDPFVVTEDTINVHMI